MRSLTTDHNGAFIVVGMDNPRGFQPGLYYYVMHLATGRKVSKYLRRPSSASRKATRYAAMWAAGDRYWPEVDRSDELRTNKYALGTLKEWFNTRFMGGALDLQA